MQWWFKKFCKGDKHLEDEHSGRPSEVDNDQLKAITEADLLQLHKKLPKNSKSTILWSFGIWRKLEKWKGSLSGCLMSWPQIKKIDLKCRLFLFYETMNNFSIGLWHVTKSAFYAASNDQLGGWTKKKLQSTSQSQTCTQKSHGHYLVVCCWCDPLQLSESWQNHYIWSMLRCKTHRKLQHLQLPLVNIKGPILLHDDAWCGSHNQHFKSWTNWATELCLIHHIHPISCQLTTTSSSISTPYCREKASTNSRMQKMLFKSSLNPKAWIFMLQE